MDERLQFIFRRRSIRDYTRKPVAEDTVTLLLQAAMSAPSAMAQDPWRFVVLRQPDHLRRMAEVLPHGKMLAEAAVGIMVCGDLTAAHDQQLSYLLQDCSAAIENLLLAAAALGLGACWLGIHPRATRIQAVSERLGLPANIIPVAGIAVGYPAESLPARTRYRPEYVQYEQWSPHDLS